ncbi:MAG: DNA-formamidopyrimidine glycosylase family protein, partial [Planctomycetota bacterium]
MPELPDVAVYCEALGRHYTGRTIEKLELKSPFLVRSFEPDLSEAIGRRVEGFSRLGKRIVWHLENDLHLVVHLMIAGRFHRKRAGTKPKGKNDLLAWHFASDESRKADTLMLTEASPQKRASLHVVEDEAELVVHNPGGLEPLSCSLAEFRAQLVSRNHTLKRSLTSPRLFSGIGNAYSDEILHAAQLSPIKWTSRLDEEEIGMLHAATQQTLSDWVDRLREQCGDGFPEKVTAFHPDMAVHGRFGQPCPACQTAIQRIRYASNETNYCPRCQTDGKVLADRSLSR